MEKIKSILLEGDISIEKLIECIELVKSNGDVAVIKFDGERAEKPYTVFITFPTSKRKEMIRRDGVNLQVTLIDVLNEYINGI